MNTCGTEPIPITTLQGGWYPLLSTVPTGITELLSENRVMLTNEGRHSILCVGFPLLRHRGAIYQQRNGWLEFQHYAGMSRSHSRKIARQLKD